MIETSIKNLLKPKELNNQIKIHQNKKTKFKQCKINLFKFQKILNLNKMTKFAHFVKIMIKDLFNKTILICIFFTLVQC
jgi:uncharacterized membrane protein